MQQRSNASTTAALMRGRLALHPLAGAALAALLSVAGCTAEHPPDYFDPPPLPPPRIERDAVVVDLAPDIVLPRNNFV